MEKSYFDGGLLKLILYRLLGGIITAFTLGLAAPWAMVLVLRWKTRHTVIDGHRLYFDGSAMSLFGQWIKWLFLTIITLGIYGFWVQIKIMKWTTKHTHIVQ